MGAFVDLTGRRFGKLLVTKKHQKLLSGRVAWECLCDYGNLTITMSNSLLRGKTQSCGCIRKKNAALQSFTAGVARGIQLSKHRKCGERLYNVWKGMRDRCHNPNNKSYMDYGGRGIAVCDEWNDYLVFRKWAYENGYDENAPYGTCTIDRIDVNSNYEPKNCRFTDSIQQANNRRPRRKKNGF